MEKPMIHLPFEVLAEGKHWKVGQAYRVKLVLRQTNLGEDGALFEVLDASSLEPDDKAKKRFLATEAGIMKG